MSWISRFIYANWNYLMGGLVLLMVFICGVQIGESRIQREWNAEKLRVALVVAKQEQRAADVQQSQSQSIGKYQMNTPKTQRRWAVAYIVFVLSGCAAAPQSVPGVCPQFPQLPQELQASPPTLYLLPLEMRGR